MEENIYSNIDEARKLIKKRQLDSKLLDAVNKELGNKKIQFFEGPRSVIWRSMLSPDNGFNFYHEASAYLGLKMSPFEYLDDKYVTINAEKKALSKIKFYGPNGEKNFIEIVDNSTQEGKPLKEIVTKSGESLKKFHGDLFKISYPNLTLCDISSWCKSIGLAKDYYYEYFLHFLCHGVLFESFDTENLERESRFMDEAFYPNMKKVLEKFQIKPLIVRLYPEDQTGNEDFYWFAYKKPETDFILNYAHTNNLKIKTI